MQDILAIRLPSSVSLQFWQRQKLRLIARAEDLMRLARHYYSGRQGIGSTDAGSASPDTTEEVNMFGTPEEVVEKNTYVPRSV
ncbi:MAG: hypothetical protein Ct9H300mP27_12100 [Chloroflexota bacterium]|nr:MAG: hypothetical protein Ct9H300mP27_12100 [Chloroflexota bacterium]